MVARDPSWRLPALSGRRARVVLGAYACLATLIFVIIAGSFWFNARDYFGNIPAAAEYGFRTHTNDASYKTDPHTGAKLGLGTYTGALGETRTVSGTTVSPCTSA